MDCSLFTSNQKDAQALSDYLTPIVPEGMTSDRFNQMVDLALDMIFDSYEDDLDDWSDGRSWATKEGLVNHLVNIGSYRGRKIDLVRERWKLLAMVMFSNDLSETPTRQEVSGLYDKFNKIPQDLFDEIYHP